MASSRSFPYIHAPFVNSVLSSRSVYSPTRTLLAIISGVDEGIVQGILWESLPLTRVFIKESLALAAFLTYYCSSQAGGPLWCLNTGAVFSIPVEGQPLLQVTVRFLGVSVQVGRKERSALSLVATKKK